MVFENLKPERFDPKHLQAAEQPSPSSSRVHILEFPSLNSLTWSEKYSQ